LPSVKQKHSVKTFFAECKKTIGKDLLCRVPKKQSAKSLFAECFFSLSKELFCRVPKKLQSANHLVLGKEPVSGSVSDRRTIVIGSMTVLSVGYRSGK
jgi:hypothetical protein